MNERKKFLHMYYFKKFALFFGNLLLLFQILRTTIFDNPMAAAVAMGNKKTFGWLFGNFGSKISMVVDINVLI